MKKNLSAKKSLGQNFLKSKKALKQMIEEGNISENDLVIEIGPGKGALTRPLLETGAKVIAFELDERMIDFLNEEFSDYIKNKKLEIIHKDILDIDMDTFFAEKEAYKIVANIPYYITNAILRKFLETKYQPSDMVLLVQKEVAERIIARDGKQSILSLSVALFGEAKYIAKVDRKYFSPSPKVHSAIIHIKNISHNKLKSEKKERLFFELIRAGFAHKRKKTIRNLEKIAAKEIWKDIFSTLLIDENTRAEELNIEMWLKILDLYLKKTNIKYR
jgi:16S rRNA (adenine1518-N6/adenine1519-N6)-dimethyltransferase